MGKHTHMNLDPECPTQYEPVQPPCTESMLVTADPEHTGILEEGVGDGD